MPDTVYACQHHIALVVSGKASGFLKEVSETAALTFGGMRTFLFFSSSLWLSAHGSVHSLFSFLFFTVAQCTHGSVHRHFSFLFCTVAQYTHGSVHTWLIAHMAQCTAWLSEHMAQCTHGSVHTWRSAHMA